MKHNKKLGAVALELIVSAGILGALGFGLVFMNAGNIKDQQQSGANNLRDDKAFIEDSKGSESMITKDIVLNTDIVHMNVGESFELSASVQPSNLWNTKLIWEVYKNPSKVAISVSGDTMKLTVKALENGIIKLKVRANDGSRVYKTVKIIVGSPVVFTASQRDLGRVTAGDSAEMAVYASPADYSPSKVQITWSVEEGYEYATFEKNTNILKVTPKVGYEDALIRVHASAYDVLYEQMTEFDFTMSVLDVYTISYTLNGFPDPMNPETYTKETPTFALKNPSLVGYTFTGWTGSNGTTPNTNVQITKGSIGNKNFTANKFANTYKINYDGNGATSGTTVSSNHTYDKAKNLTKNEYERIGYEFTGWNTASDGKGTSYTDEQNVLNLKSGNGDELTLYAQWSQIKYTLTIDPNGGYRVSDNNSSIIVGNNYTYGYVDTISERAKTGYQLTGYVMTNTATGSTTDIGGATLTYNASTKTATFTQGTVEVTITAQWRPNKLTINYYSNNATAAYSGTLNAVGDGKNVLVRVWETDYEYNTTDNLHDYSYTSATTYLGRTGYTATGYWGSTTSGGTLVSESTNYASAKELASAYGKDLGAGDVVLNLYAQWKINSYTVTQYHYYYHEASASWKHFQTTTDSRNYKTSFAPYNVTSPSGYYAGNNYGVYNAAGSSVGSGTVGTNSFTVTENMSVHVHYYANTYTVTYNCNGGTGSCPSSTSFKYDSGAKISSSTPTRANYTFTHWSYGGNTFAPGAAIPSGWGSFTLTANWRAHITQYRCRYWGSWSGWQNSAVSSSSTRQVETKWIDTSYWNGWSGWQNSYVGSSSTRQVETKWVDTSYWGSWSGWTTTAYSSSSTRNVETRTAYTAWSDSSYRDNGTTIIRRELWHDCYNNTDICSIDTNLYSFWTYQGNMKLVKNGVTTTGNERYFVWNTTADANDSYWLFGKTGSGTVSNGGSGALMATGTWSLGDMAYSMSFVRYGSSNVYTAAWGRYLKRSAYTEYRYRDYISQGYTQYRYRDYISQGYTQYRYRDMGSWSSWSTSDCSSGYAGRETRYGDYNK